MTDEEPNPFRKDDEDLGRHTGINEVWTAAIANTGDPNVKVRLEGFKTLYFLGYPMIYDGGDIKEPLEPSFNTALRKAIERYPKLHESEDIVKYEVVKNGLTDRIFDEMREEVWRRETMRLIIKLKDKGLIVWNAGETGGGLLFSKDKRQVRLMSNRRVV